MRHLTGLRGVAAASVILYHANVNIVGDFRVTFLATPPNGQYAVMIFFMLSGFLMGKLYLGDPPTFENERLLKYATARFGRVGPLYLAVLMISACILQSPAIFISGITFVNMEQIQTNYTIHLWTVATEYNIMLLLHYFGSWRGSYLRGPLACSLSSSLSHMFFHWCNCFLA